MAVLNGRQTKQLREALLKAFPSRSALEEAVYYQLGGKLVTITPEGSLTDMTFGLINWAESHGKTAELVNAALTVNPGNPALQEFAKSYHETSAMSPPVGYPSWEDVPTDHLRRELIEALSEMPEADSFQARSSLLTGLPWTSTLMRDSNPMVDVRLLVDQLSNLGQLKSGAWPLLLLIDNAIAYAEGSATEETLRHLRQRLAAAYEATIA